MLSRRFDRVTRFTRRDAVRLAVATIVLVGGLTAILSIGDLPQAYNLQEGSVAPVQIRAPRAIQFESIVQTAQARQAASDAIGPQYDFRADTASSLAQRQLAALATALAPVDAAFAGPLTQDQRSLALAGTLPGVSVAARKTLDAMAADRWSLVAAETTRVLGMLQRSELRDSEMEGTRRNLGGLFSVQMTDDERGLATEIVDPLLVPNSTYSAALTAEARQAAADAVTPVQVAVAKGQILVDAGAVVTAADIETLQAFGLTEARLDIARIAGWFLLASLIVILYLAWLWRYRQELWHRARTLALLGLVLLVTALAYKLTAGRSVVPFFVPGAGAGMLVAILLGAGPATVLSFFVAIIAGTSNDLSLELATYVFVGSLTGILAVRRGDRVAVFIQAGVAIAVANIVVVSIFSLLGTRDITGVLQLFGASAAAAAGAAVATVGTFQVVGNLFGILTVFQLLELANPSQALLRRLLLETPGTYHHALMVGNLAERAAEAIGADSLLARVASYYHDVGKLENPVGFIENQAGGDNIHDHLSAEASAALLKAHISGGIDLAYRAKLPKPLIAFIPQHHGTARMSYFWAKAREEAAAPHGGLGTSAGLAAADALDERKFRHNGPKPQSKEAAILMLADGVEASVRSLGIHDEHPGPGARDEERHDGAPRGELVGERGHEEDQAQQGERPRAVPELLSVAPQPGEVEDHDESREQEPAGDARDVQARLRQAEGGELLDIRGVDSLAGVHDDLALCDGDLHRRDGVRRGLARLRGERRAVGRVRHEERVDDLGCQASLVVGHLDREQPAQVATGALHLRVAQLGSLEHAQHARGLGRNERPAVRGHRVEGLASGHRDAGERPGEGQAPLVRGQRPREGRVDGRKRGRERRELALRQGRRGVRPKVVLGPDRIACGLACLGRLDDRLELDRPGGPDLDGRDAPLLEVVGLGEVADRQDGGQAADEHDRGDREPYRIAPREAGDPVESSGEHRSAGMRAAGGSGVSVSMRGRVVRGEVGGHERLRDEPADLLPVRAAADRGSQPAHHAAHVAGRRCAGGGDCVRDEGAQLVVRQGRREVLRDDRDLRLLLRGEVLAAARAVRLDRLAAGLHLAGQDAERGVVGEAGEVALLLRVDAAPDHPERVAAQRITRPHGRGDVVVNAISKGHRRWLLSRPAPGAPAARGGVATRRRCALGASGARGSGWK